jgi:hypothetical protein
VHSYLPFGKEDKMKHVVWIIAISLAWATHSSGVELLENGDFEQSLSVGWTQETQGLNYTFQRSTTFDPDPDYEVYVRKYLMGYAILTQTVPVTSLNLLFTADAQFVNLCESNPYGYFAASAVRIEYENSGGTVLGESRIYRGTALCNWVSTSTLHLIQAQNASWNYYEILLEDEMAYLPGVDSKEISQITISLYAYSTEDC